MESICNIKMMLNAENLVEKFLAERSGSPIFLYGVGAGVMWYIELLKELSIPIAGLCDSFLEEKKDISFQDEMYTAYPLKYVYENWGGGSGLCDSSTQA